MTEGEHIFSVTRVRQLSGAVVLKVLLALSLVCSAVAGAKAAERRVALVIGNGAYRAVARLENPGRDAEAIAIALRQAGFDRVQVEHDLGRDAMLAALKRFESEADQSDWALVYFAGHGIEVGGTNYLIPTDAKLRSDRDADEEAVALGQVQKRVEGARKLRIVILDACRENPFAVPMRHTLASRSIGRGLARPDVPQAGSLVAFAAGTGQVASDGVSSSGANSPYAAALVKNFAQPDVEVNLFFRKVRADVLAATGQAQEPATYESLPAERYVFRPFVPEQAARPQPKQDDAASSGVDAAFLDMIATVTDHALLERLAVNTTPSVRDAARKRLAGLAGLPTAQGSTGLGGVPTDPRPQVTASLTPPSVGTLRKLTATTADGKPKLVVQNGPWSVYVVDRKHDGGRECYVVGALGDYYVMVSTQPSDKRTEEVAFSARDTPAGTFSEATIDGTTFPLSAQGGNAWIKNVDEEKRFVSLLRSGTGLRIRSLGKAGAIKTEGFPLPGASTLFDRALQECPSSQP